MELTILVLLLPFFSFLTPGIGGKWMPHRAADTIGTLILEAVVALSYATAIQYFSAPQPEGGAFATLAPYNFTWSPFTGTLHFDLGILLGPISAMMLIVISAMSLMVHIYSFGYMRGEVGFQRYYAFLSLFTMSMLGLVVTANTSQMYLFRELMGVGSCLLVGFYYTKPAVIVAPKRAPIATHFADLGSLIGVLTYGYYGGAFGFTPNTVSLISGGASMLPLALGLMSVGGAGKNTMLPLYIWLPDMMEGPTPVSVSIHAATMVVAGVYPVARISPLFIAYTPNTLHMVVWVGVLTVFYVASVACVQSDIKHALAFSTISQISSMMVTLGICTSMDPHEGGLGYTASMFYLFIHAMLRALLFLDVDSITHAVHSNEMLAMEGLRKYVLTTHWTFLIAYSAIADTPPFSGFFLKDEVLAAHFQYSLVMGWVMTVIAAMTTFYVFRLYCGIFWGRENKELHAHHAPYESPLAMTFPLMSLAAVTCGAGFIPSGHLISSNGESYSIHLGPSMAITSVVIAIISIAIATQMYKNAKQPAADSLEKQSKGLHKAAYDRFCIDDIYQFTTYKIIFRCIPTPITWFDRRVVDEFFNFLVWATNTTSDETRGLQSSQVQQYAYVFLYGAPTLILLLIL